jgi:hypothetical protein
METYIKVRFLHGDKSSGRAYCYKTDIDVKPGDIVQINSDSRGIVVDEPVDMGWVESYGSDKIKKIAGKVEQEQNPAPAYNPTLAAESQVQYCKKNELPHFVPDDGVCYLCHQNIYTEGRHRSGLPSKGISVEAAGNHLITGCPHCHFSFCD